MRRFVIAYIDFFENQIHMMETKANTPVEALYNGAFYFDFDTGDFKTTDEDEFFDFCNDCDCAMSYYEIA